MPMWPPPATTTWSFQRTCTSPLSASLRWVITQLVKNANSTARNAAPTSINTMPTTLALSGALCSVMSP